MKSIFFIVFILSCQFSLAQTIEGKVVDEEGAPVIGAEVLILPDSVWGITGIDGDFELRIQQPPFELEVFHVGYAQYNQAFESIPNQSVSITLTTKEEYLDIVHVAEEHAKQELSLTNLHLDEEYFNENNQSTFAMLLDELPGISAINVGTGIAKPVIRGLYGNRILVNDQGIKQEGQQWGTDHGLEIDPYSVDRLEIIKGPAALQYGSDALGGVINIMQKKIPPRNSISGSVSGIYNSNNEYWGGSAQIDLNHKDFFINGRYSANAFGDFKVPATSFTYNGFELPIFDQTVKNTAGKNENFHITTGYQSANSITKLTYSQYAFEGGFFSGAVGIPRSYTLQPDGDNRNIDVPFQKVVHDKWILNQTFSWGEDHWVINMGYQRNRREEHSFPEYHSVRASTLEEGETLGLGFDLQTYDINSHYEYHPSAHWKHIVGMNAQWQDHKRDGFEYLLPDYKTFRSGAYSISEWQLNRDWKLNGGLRLDYAQNNSEAYTQYIFNRNEQVIDSLVSPKTNDDFLNYAIAAGLHHTLSEKWALKFNLARTFRIPYPNETVSNGVHHGTFRHEIGNKDLETERGLQLDLNLIFDHDRTHISFSTYANYFQDYIYLRPSAQFSRLPEAGQIFRYVQNNAFFTGMELSVEQDFATHFTYGLQAEGLYSVNTDQNTALPFTPPASVFHSLAYQFNSTSIFKRSQIKLQHQYTAAQNRVDRNERTTPGYHLLQLQGNTSLDLGFGELRIDVEVFNLFNTSYLRHLSRYRLLNLPEQGRNVVVRTSVKF